MSSTIAILEFGSQYAQLIARRVRECMCTASWCHGTLRQNSFVRFSRADHSFRSRSVYEAGAPHVQDFVLRSGLPPGICYGMQALTPRLAGTSIRQRAVSADLAEIQLLPGAGILEGLRDLDVPWGPDPRLPVGFVSLALANSPHAAMADIKRRYFGLHSTRRLRTLPAERK
jgi:GMP synthase (glutamine-hydrolysing)